MRKIRPNELEAGRELDMIVALAVGWELREKRSPDHPTLHWYSPESRGWIERVPDYSTNIAEAFTLVNAWIKERASEGDSYCFDLFFVDGDGWCCELKINSGKTIAEFRKGDSAEIAICYAIIEATGNLETSPLRGGNWSA